MTFLPGYANLLEKLCSNKYMLLETNTTIKVFHLKKIVQEAWSSLNERKHFIEIQK